MQETIIKGKKLYNLKIRSPKVRRFLEELYIDYKIDPVDNVVLFDFKDFNFSIKRANGLDYFITKMLHKAYQDGYKQGSKSLESSIIRFINEKNNSNS
jgi:hypothetical protein